MMKKTEFNQNSHGQKLIICGLMHLIEKEGYTTHEAMQLLRSIKNNTFHALLEIEKENK